MTLAASSLLTDLYELTMLQSYFHEGMNGTAVFDLFVRRLPERRQYLVAAGLEHVLAYLETLSFSAEAIAYLESLNRFSPEFLTSLADFRFEGDIYAVPEGTVWLTDFGLAKRVQHADMSVSQADTLQGL